MADKGYPGNNFQNFLNQGGEIAGAVTVSGTLTATGALSANLGNDIQLLTNAGAPTNGVTGADAAGPGSLLVDYTNKFLYINTNTKASPTWTKVGLQT